MDVVVAAYEREGLQVEAELRSASFARLDVRSAAESSKVELGLDWRKNEPIRLAVGPVLHADDAVANKVCALFGRAEVRDYVDVDAILTSGRYTEHELLSLARDRLGGMCVLPIPARHNRDGQGGIAVSWTTHNLLTLDWDRGREHHDTQQAMNRALASVLKALGYQVGPFGTGGAFLVTEPRRGGPPTTPRTRSSRGRR